MHFIVAPPHFYLMKFNLGALISVSTQSYFFFLLGNSNQSTVKCCFYGCPFRRFSSTHNVPLCHHTAVKLFMIIIWTCNVQALTKYQINFCHILFRPVTNCYCIYHRCRLQFQFISLFWRQLYCIIFTTNCGVEKHEKFRRINCCGPS